MFHPFQHFLENVSTNIRNWNRFCVPKSEFPLGVPQHLHESPGLLQDKKVHFENTSVTRLKLHIMATIVLLLLIFSQYYGSYGRFCIRACQRVGIRGHVSLRSESSTNM